MAGITMVILMKITMGNLNLMGVIMISTTTHQEYAPTRWQECLTSTVIWKSLRMTFTLLAKVWTGMAMATFQSKNSWKEIWIFKAKSESAKTLSLWVSSKKIYMTLSIAFGAKKIFKSTKAMDLIFLTNSSRNKNCETCGSRNTVMSGIGTKSLRTPEKLWALGVSHRKVSLNLKLKVEVHPIPQKLNLRVSQKVLIPRKLSLLEELWACSKDLIVTWSKHVACRTSVRSKSETGPCTEWWTKTKTPSFHAVNL